MMLIGIVIIGCLAVAVVYSVLPNIAVRMFHLFCTWKGPSDKWVALTFDDGPDPKYTPRLLTTLRQCGVRATFFVIAEKAIRHPEIIREMLLDGHDVQIHGMTHSCVPFLGPRRTNRQLVEAAHQLKNQFGIEANWYRPTWGLCNVVSLFLARRHQFRLVTWSVMVGDWRVTSASTLLQRILNRVEPGAIICLHDSDETIGSQSGAPETVLSLIPQLTLEIRERGMSLTSLTHMMASQRISTPGPEQV